MKYQRREKISVLVEELKTISEKIEKLYWEEQEFIWGEDFLKGQNIFEANTRTFYIEYDNIRGLNKASLVSINGLQVGSVSDITFNPDPAKKGMLIVKISVDYDFEFTKNSIVKMYSTGIIGGEALAIIPSYEGDPAESGDFLKGEVESGLINNTL